MIEKIFGTTLRLYLAFAKINVNPVERKHYSACLAVEEHKVAHILIHQKHSHYREGSMTFPLD